MYYVNHKLTTIPFDELENRSGDAGKLVKEYEEFKKDPKNKKKKLDAKSKAIRNMVAKIVGSVNDCNPGEGLPACHWHVYAGIGVLIGVLLVPSLAFWRLRASARGDRSP